MKRSCLILALLASLQLTGCASDGGLASHGRPLDPATLRLGHGLDADGGAAAWPAPNWWQTLRDPQLDRLIEHAYAHSPTLEETRARIDRANAMLSAQRAAGGAYLGLDGSAARQRFSNYGLFPAPLAGSEHTSADLALNFRYEFDFWGLTRNRVQAQVSRLDAERLEARAVELTLASAVAQSYVDLARTERQLALAQRYVDLREREVALFRARIGEGLDTAVSLKEASAAVPMARAEVEALRNQATLLRHQLAVLTGQDPAAGEQIAVPTLRLDSALALPPRLDADLVAHRPEIAAQRMRLEAASRDIDAAHAEFYPNIDLVASGGLDALDASDLFKAGSKIFGFGIALHLPVFDAGRLRAGLAVSHADYDAEVALYNKLVLDAFRDVADQVATWRSLDVQQREHDRARLELEETVKVASARHREGLTNRLVVLNVQDRLLAQQRADADLDARRLQTAIQLYRALGGGIDLSAAANRAS